MDRYQGCNCPGTCKQGLFRHCQRCSLPPVNSKRPSTCDPTHIFRLNLSRTVPLGNIREPATHSAPTLYAVRHTTPLPFCMRHIPAAFLCGAYLRNAITVGARGVTQAHRRQHFPISVFISSRFSFSHILRLYLSAII